MFRSEDFFCAPLLWYEHSLNYSIGKHRRPWDWLGLGHGRLLHTPPFTAAPSVVHSSVTWGTCEQCAFSHFISRDSAPPFLGFSLPTCRPHRVLKSFGGKLLADHVWRNTALDGSSLINDILCSHFSSFYAQILCLMNKLYVKNQFLRPLHKQDTTSLSKVDRSLSLVRLPFRFCYYHFPDPIAAVNDVGVTGRGRWWDPYQGSRTFTWRMKVTGRKKE